MFSKTSGTSSPKTVSITTETEHTLYKAYKDEKAAKENLKIIVEELKKEIVALQQQIQVLMEEKKVGTSGSSTAAKENPSQPMEYQTDEEDLAQETEWIRVKSRKKRKLSASPPQHHHSEDTTGTDKLKQKTKKMPLPPPIMVSGVDNYQTFFDLVSSSVTDASCFAGKMMNGNNVKINALTEDAYRSVTKILTENRFLWHSYENKQERPIRVMAKKLPASCLPQRIVEDLQSKGYKIEDAVNKLRWRSKDPLNMFTLTFSKEEDINKIYEIKYILGCKVEIHPIKTSKLVPQCKKCQAYGHTQKYCAREARCVKCTGKHLTRDCTKPSNEKPKCVHCGEGHPASYRGCIVAKEMQALKNKNAKKRTVINAQRPSRPEIIKDLNQNKSNQITLHSTNTNERQTYAQKVSKKLPDTQAPQLNMEKKLDEILKYISSFDERLKNLESGTKQATKKSRK